MKYNNFKTEFENLISGIEISNETTELVLTEARLFFIKERIFKNNSRFYIAERKSVSLQKPKRKKGRYSYSIKPSNREKLREISLPEGFRSDSLMLSYLINNYKKGTYTKDSYHREGGVDEKKKILQFNLDDSDKNLLESLAKEDGFKSASALVDYLIEAYEIKSKK